MTPQGALASKTRLLVTHQLQYLHDCDRVVVMEDGRITHVGSLDELTAAGVDVSGFVTAAVDDEEGTPASALPATVASLLPQPSIESKAIAESDSASLVKAVDSNEIATQSLVPVIAASTAAATPREGPPTATKYAKRSQSRDDLTRAGKLMTTEFRVEGAVKKGTLTTYLDVSVAG